MPSVELSSKSTLGKDPPVLRSNAIVLLPFWILERAITLVFKLCSVVVFWVSVSPPSTPSLPIDWDVRSRKITNRKLKKLENHEHSTIVSMDFQVLGPRQKTKMEKKRKSLNLDTAANHTRLAEI